MNKKFYMESLGCSKNQVDAEVIINLLKEKGYELSLDPNNSNLIFINTCGFIQSAKEEAIENLFELREKAPNAKIIFGGCLAQRYSDILELPEADGIFGNRDLKQICEFVDKLEKEDEQIILSPEYPDNPEDDYYSRSTLLNYPGSAYLKLSEGCNHRCAFCAIPVIRGPLRSRSKIQILKEANDLVKEGIKEINIIAQDLAAFGMDTTGESQLLPLLEEICDIEGDFKIRLLYIHPDAFPLELIEFVKTHEKVLPYFDIPFQHASIPILRKMGRVGTSDSYYNLIKLIRESLPNAVIRTTLMLGFPGETEEDVKQLLEFTKKCKFDWMGSFIYSREEDTRAFDMISEEDHEKVIKRAKKDQKKLERIQEKITSNNLQKFVDNVYDALIEEKIEGEDLAIGRIYSQAPEVDGATVIMGRNLKPGSVVKVGIRKVNGVDLDAVILGEFNG
ncbi:MAG: 30S ribosomal protein S12 methylthiotransferase RimO [Spirochaetia bacterium]|nr:30S ribosomal protein S12 methylthiotransferase RimO [Spirochaetia bacterium]